MGVYSNLAAHVNESAVKGNPDALLDFMCEATSAELKMFDSIIELDIQEAVANKNGGSYIMEADEAQDKAEASILDKIKALLSKVYHAIKEAFETFIVKIQEAFGADKKLAAKYGDISGVDFSKCEATVTVAKEAATIKDTKELMKNFKDAGEILGSFKEFTADNVDDESEKLIKSFVDSQKTTVTDFKFNDMYEKSAANKADKTFLSKTLKLGYDSLKNGFSRQIKDLNNTKTDVLNNINKIKSDCGNVIASRKNGEDSDGVKIYNAAYKVLSKYYGQVSKSCSLIISLTKQELLVARGTYVRLGKWNDDQKKKDKNKDTKAATESAEMFGVLSDLFVEDALDIM